MSTPPMSQNPEEHPSTPLPEPNLDFTAHVQSLLNGVTPRTPDNGVPRAPDSILNTGPQSEESGAPMENDGMEENTNTDEGGNNTSNQERTAPVNPTDNGGMPTVDEGTRAVQEFFNLDVENQAVVLLNYKQQMSELVQQNKEMAILIEAVNEDRNKLNSQIDTALRQNAELLKTLKETPDVETITTQVKDTLDKEYELKFKILQDNADREKEVQELNHKTILEKQNTHYKDLLNQGLSKIKNDYEQKMREEKLKTESKFEE